jgi:hypothetical protein
MARALPVRGHLREVYGADVSKQTISTITDKVIEGMAEWQNRPLDSIYPVIFVDRVRLVGVRDAAAGGGGQSTMTIRVLGAGRRRSRDDPQRPAADPRRPAGRRGDLRGSGRRGGGRRRAEAAPGVSPVDIRMPRLDGPEVTRALAGPGVAGPLRVVIVTTFDLDESARKSRGLVVARPLGSRTS